MYRAGARITASLAVLACTVGIEAAHAAPKPRFYAKNMKAALAFAERSNDRRPGFSGTQCRGLQGSDKSGYRHISCVGNYEHDGPTYRFEVVATPIGCVHSVFAVSEATSIGGNTATVRVMNWEGTPFSCRSH
jgi:hypothetical protein